MTVYCRVMSRYHVCVWLPAGGQLCWYLADLCSWWCNSRDAKPV